MWKYEKESKYYYLDEMIKEMTLITKYTKESTFSFNEASDHRDI